MLLEMLNITKSFPGVRALDKACLSAEGGEIHALLGENGAGKSTLIKILTGVIKKDSGDISIAGHVADIRNPKTAAECGISTIYQEFSLVGSLSVAENIYLGKEFTSLGIFVDKKKMVEEAEATLARLGFHIPPERLIEDLSTSEKQIVEIAKALSANARIFIMDEPTSSLTEKEKDILFRIMRNLKDRGVLIIFITHRLDEVIEISDRLTVLRDGRSVGEYQTKNLKKEQIIALITGSDVTREPTMGFDDSKTDVVMRIQHLCRKNLLNDINFDLLKGEVLGISGLVGSGKSELARSILGLDHPDSGEIILEGKKMDIGSMRRALDAGFGYISEDRRRDTLFPEFTVRENITISSLSDFCRHSFILRRRERESVRSLIERLRIKASSQEQQVKFLSGGNQQKVAISRCLLLSPKILILDEPTIGVDVGAKAEIYGVVEELTRGGISVIFISSDFEEILKVSSRILVMKDGEIRGILPNRNLSKEDIIAIAMN